LVVAARHGGCYTRVTMVTVRRATEDDAAGILELNGVHNGDNVAVEIASAFRAGYVAPSDFAVAVAGDRVVSTVGLLPLQLRVGDVVIPVGQPEFIATDPAFRRQGLVRRLLDLVHGWSAERGDLVQVVFGIPFFYRQFGYSYGLRRPLEWLVPPETDLAAGGGWGMRAAEPSDITEICLLEDAAQDGATVRLPFARELWPVLLDLPHAPVLVAMAGDRVEAVTRVRTGPGEPVHLQALAAASPVAAGALIAAVRTDHPGHTLVVGERPALPLRGVLGAAVPVARPKWIYVRIAEPGRLLRHLRPVLDARLAASPFASSAGRIEVSFYRSGAAIEYRGGRVAEVTTTARDDSEGSSPDVHIPPDLLPALLFGPGNVLDWEHDPDVDLGHHRDVMAALFPALSSDVLVW
jgi:predicted N-acetyltransferase YhbS